MRLLFIGDLVGSGGRKLLKEKLPDLKQRFQVDVCIANAENAAAGLGLTAPIVREIKAAGVDLISMGNHTWARHDFLESIDSIKHIARPANVPAAWPGVGHAVLKHDAGTVLLINLLGRVFMDPVDDPFAAADRLLDELKAQYKTRLTVIDFHAETTAEKNAMARYLNGRVTLLAGTHTHVQTADEQILDRGTAFITDVGMTGPVQGVIGMDEATSLRRFVDRLPAQYRVAKGECALCAVLVEANPENGQAVSIERIRIDE